MSEKPKVQIKRLVHFLEIGMSCSRKREQLADFEEQNTALKGERILLGEKDVLLDM